MKKFLSLVTLALMTVSSAWAQTSYVNEVASVKWTFQDGTTLTADDISVPEAFLSTGFSYGSMTLGKNTNVTFKDDANVYTFNTITNSTGSSVSNITLEWTVTPYPGTTFKPTNVYLEACRLGHNNGKITITAVYGDGTSKVLKAEHEVGRNNTNGYTAYTTDDLAITDGVASENPFILRVTINKLDNGKADGFRNVKIDGVVNGTPEIVTIRAINVESSDDAIGTVAGGGNVIDGEKTTLTATPNVNGKFVKWQKDGEDFSGNTDNPLEVTATADATYTAVFKKLFKVSFAAGDGADKGTTPNALVTEYQETSYTTPAKNSYIAKSGYTATGWTDGTNDYGFNETITLTDDIELKPIFTANTKVLSESKSDVEVTWEFRRKNGGAELNIENATGYYVVQKSVSGETQDFAIAINNVKGSGYEGKTGKTNNTSSDKQTQVNAGSKYTIPAVKGMEIRINAANAFDTETSGSKYETTIGGVSMNDYLTSSQKGIVYKYDGETGTTDIIFGSGFGYLYNIVITYPGTVVTAEVNSTYGWATFCSSKALDFTGITDVKAYVVTNHSDKAIIKTQVTGAVKANTPLLLEGATTEIPVATTTGTDYSGTNKLHAGTGTAVAYEDNKTKYVLGVNTSTNEAEFQKIVSKPATVAVGKAYLEFDEVISAPALSFDFSDMETTGINAVSKAQMENGNVYNLNGQRVSKPAKGLYIVNGKKVAIK